MAEGGVNFSDIHHSSIQAETIVGGNYTVIKNFVVGPDKLPTDYATRIKNFLREYLGDNKNKVPFGGRAPDFATLNQWLADPDAPSCLFMSAEAGRGKSALLVRWASYLEQFEDVHVVFLPISIRFETAAQEVFYTVLAARLSTVYGDEVKYSQLSAEQWKGVADQYLQQSSPDGKQVVVIIDGLDEATGWQPGASFMPLPLPTGVRAVVSKRVKAEENKEANLRQLGWQMQGTATHLTLAPLTRNGVEDVLLQMGNPLNTLVTKVDVIWELFRLTEGDPLLVRLYVDALVGQGEQVASLTAEQLQAIKPGLKGYFDQWWEDQHQKWEKEKRNPLEADKVLAFFNAVATSFGPLSKKDVLEVTKSEKISGLQLRTIAREIGRFIIGDGDTIGYTFSHPRLGYYFFEQLGDTEKEEWNRRFVKYGQSFLEKIRTEQKITWNKKEIELNAYIVQHYSAHLDRANAPYSAYYELICQEWAQVWEALRGTYEGFLANVHSVWRKTLEDPDTSSKITMQVKCALCISSISTLVQNISLELLEECVMCEILNETQAIVLLKQMDEEEKKVRGIEVFRAFSFLSHDSNYHLLEITRDIKDAQLKAVALLLLADIFPQDVLRFY